MKRLKVLLMVVISCMIVTLVVPMAEVKGTVNMTLAQLREKFPHGKYWNHIGSDINNPDGWTSTACTHHSDGCTLSGSCGCNNVGKGWNAIQCMGFAYKLGYDAFGSNPGSSWTTVTGTEAKNYVLYNIKPGDVVRFNNNGHSMFVTGVSGDTITYAECNVKGTCIIRWDRTITRANLNKTLTNVKIAPDTFKENDFNIRFYYNLYGGTGNFPIQTLKYNGTLVIPTNTLVRNGYKFIGFAGYRSQDKKFYASGKGWYTYSDITSNNYTLKLYQPGESYVINKSWTTNPAKQYAFTMAAQWEAVDIYVKYDACGGTGSYDMTYVIDNPIALPTSDVMVRSGYELKGFYFYREEDQTYSTNNGWQTQDAIDLNGYEKKLFAPGSEHTVNTSWTSDFSTQDSYVFEAVWECIEPTEISLDTTELTIVRGDTYTLEATILPEEVLDHTVTWVSSDKSIVKVDSNGKLTPVSAGIAYVTATTSNGLSATCEVSVEDKPFPFTDVNEGDWFKEYVNEAYQLGLMTGANETLFKPYVKMNRGMVAIVLQRMSGAKANRYQSIFPDVKYGDYYANSVTWAKLNGVINGYGDGTFRPLKEVTREEMAQMLYNFALYKGVDVDAEADLTQFLDGNKVSSWHKDAMVWAVANGLISGKYNGTKLDPQGTASRAECSKMLVAAYNTINK